MPVGHEVTPTRLSTRLACRCSGSAGAVSAPPGASARGGGAAAGWSSATSALTMRTTSASVVAAARAALKSFFMRARASLGSICMCASPPPSGAAMRKISVAGPSLAPQSMPSAERPKTSDGSVIAVLRACGMPMPPGSPVAIVSSRLRTSSRNVSRSVHRPEATRRSPSLRVASWRSAPVRSRTTCSSVMRDMGFSFRGGTIRWFGVWWARQREDAVEVGLAGQLGAYAVEVVG